MVLLFSLFLLSKSSSCKPISFLIRHVHLSLSKAIVPIANAVEPQFLSASLSPVKPGHTNAKKSQIKCQRRSGDLETPSIYANGATEEKTEQCGKNLAR